MVITDSEVSYFYRLANHAEWMAHAARTKYRACGWISAAASLRKAAISHTEIDKMVGIYSYLFMKASLQERTLAVLVHLAMTGVTIWLCTAYSTPAMIVAIGLVGATALTHIEDTPPISFPGRWWHVPVAITWWGAFFLGAFLGFPSDTWPLVVARLLLSGVFLWEAFSETEELEYEQTEFEKEAMSFNE